MDAKEAREKSRYVNIGGADYEKAMSAINKATQDGEYYAWVYFSVKDDLRRTLTNLGYNVSDTIFDRNETLTKISW